MNKMNDALNAILNDAQLFEHISTQVFSMIDINGDGELEKNEVITFIGSICQEFGLSDGLVYEDKQKKIPVAIKGICGKDAMLEVFRQLDEDASNSVTV